jgi:hypothetical protein
MGLIMMRGLLTSVGGKVGANEACILPRIDIGADACFCNPMNKGGLFSRLQLRGRI